MVQGFGCQPSRDVLGGSYTTKHYFHGKRVVGDLRADPHTCCPRFVISHCLLSHRSDPRAADFGVAEPLRNTIAAVAAVATVQFIIVAYIFSAFREPDPAPDPDPRAAHTGSHNHPKAD